MAMFAVLYIMSCFKELALYCRPQRSWKFGIQSLVMQWARYSVLPVRMKKRQLTKGVALYLIRHFHFLLLCQFFQVNKKELKRLLMSSDAAWWTRFSVYTCIYLGRWATCDTFRYASYCFHVHYYGRKKNHLLIRQCSGLTFHEFYKSQRWKVSL